jgi:hypothetical protein
MKNALAAAAALAAIVGIYALARLRAQASLPPRPQELPIAVIVLENVDFMKKGDRANLNGLESDLLVTCRCMVQGPTQFVTPEWTDEKGQMRERNAVSVKYLIPGPKAGEPPIAKAMFEMTDKEWETAQKFFGMGDWVVPRTIGPDRRSCVIRIAPPDARMRGFPSGTAEKLQEVLARNQWWKTHVYSSALGLTDDAERKAINAVFGVQTAWVRLESSAGSWFLADSLDLLEEQRQKMLKDDPQHVRSYATPASWLHYYTNVCYDVSDRELRFPKDEAWIAKAFEFARHEKITTLTNDTGANAVVDVATDLEGADNERLFFQLGHPLSQMKNVKVRFPGKQ